MTTAEMDEAIAEAGHAVANGDRADVMRIARALLALDCEVTDLTATRDTAAHYAREDKRWTEESAAVERRLLASMAAYLLAHKPTDAADAVAAARIILAEVDRTEPSK